MRTSVILSAAFAVGALAGPVLRKRQEDVLTVVDWVDVTVTEYVTEGAGQTPTAGPAEATSCTEDSYPWSAPKPATSAPAPVTSAAPAPSSVAPSSAAPVYTHVASSAPAPYTSATPVKTSEAATGVGPAHPTGTSEGDITSGPDYQNLVLYHHWIHRLNHSASALTWNDTLASAAYDLVSKCQFQHNSAGQNLAASAPSANVSAQITDGWYNGEIMNYDPYYGMDTPTGNLDAYGHATQVIWKGSQSIGCATYDCRGQALGMWFTACNYYPFGNVSPLWGQNLEKGQGGDVASWTD